MYHTAKGKWRYRMKSLQALLVVDNNRDRSEIVTCCVYVSEVLGGLKMILTFLIFNILQYQVEVDGQYFWL